MTPRHLGTQLDTIMCCARAATPYYLGTQLATYLVANHVRKRLHDLFYKINRQGSRSQVNSHLKTFAEALNLKSITHILKRHILHAQSSNSALTDPQ